MITIIEVVVGILVVSFFWKQIKGWSLKFRRDAESKLPVTAKIDRTLSDLKSKRTKVAYALKELYKAEEIVNGQIKVARASKNDTRVEKLQSTREKFTSKTVAMVDMVKKIDDTSETLKSELSYVNAMESVSNIAGVNVSVDVDELFAEITAMEKMIDADIM